MMDKPTEAAMQTGSNTPQAMPDVPDWFGVSLTDVRSGKTFSINDARGKVILVETMAVWCTNCRIQQKEIKALHDKLGMQEDLLIISLDIDPNENQSDLKAHAEKYGFDWLYAVAPAAVAREIGNLYTQQFLNPPSTPMLVIDRHGVAHALPFGIKSGDDLAAAVNMYLSEGT
jgi:thiol-disulfide isomerase/thioredoxin